MRSLKTDLPTSRVAFKRFPTKGFGAGGVALTPPVNLPCHIDSSIANGGDRGGYTGGLTGSLTGGLTGG